MSEPKHYALTALHIVNTDLDLLRKAIEAGDPKEELLFRIKDMKATCGAAFGRTSNPQRALARHPEEENKR